jgi:flagellar FliJ protein
MSTLQPLIALLAQAERERDELQADLLRSRSAQQNAQAQAAQLRQYRGEYEQRFGARPHAGTTIEMLRVTQGFVARLTHAVEQQERVVAHAAGQVAAAEVRWREAELRVASVRKLIERRMEEVRRGADRAEQKAVDEFASRAAWAARMGAAPLRAA